MSPLALILIGLVTGFATTVWATLAISSFSRKRHLFAMLYVLLAVANLTTTGILYSRFGTTPIHIPNGVSATLLIVMTGLPPLLALVPWLRTQSLKPRRRL